jgi:hypothetical protein
MPNQSLYPPRKAVFSVLGCLPSAKSWRPSWRLAGVVACLVGYGMQGRAGDSVATGSSAKALAKSPVNIDNQRLAPTVDDRASWQLTVGAQWRQIGSLSVRNGEPRSSSFLNLPERSFFGEHEEGNYSDGYVLPDSANTGQTWNWGYDNASQIQGTTLSLSGQNTRFDETLTVERHNTEWGKDLAGVGAFAELQSPVMYRARRLMLNVVGGYSFVQDSASHSARALTSSYEINEVTERFIDAYDISNLAAPPPAPHQGTFQGPGPLLNLNRQRRPTGSDRFYSLETFTSDLEQEFDIRLHTLSLGPRVAIDLGRLRAQLGFGFAGNVTDWELRSTETLSSQDGAFKKWEDRSSGTTFLPGAYGELGLRWEFIRNWSLNAMARYDYSKSLEAEAGPAAVDLDLQGLTGSLGIGWNF